MVPQGGREELVARGEEGKPPRGQSIPVSGNWRKMGVEGKVEKGGGDIEGKKEGRDRGVQEINRGCRDEQRQGGRDGKELTARRGRRQALKDRGASKPDGNTSVPNLRPGKCLLLATLSHFIFSFSFTVHFPPSYLFSPVFPKEILISLKGTQSSLHPQE